MSGHEPHEEALLGLAEELAPSREDLSLLMRTVRREVRHRDRKRPSRSPLVAAVAVAATVLLSFGVLGGALTSALRAPPERHEAPLALQSDWVQAQPGLRLSGEGQGTLVSEGAVHRATLQQGEIHVEVDPDAHLDVEVITDEAVVHVVGTVFSVTRDARGTQISVQRGKVGVRCAHEEGQRVLGANSTGQCFGTAGGALIEAVSRREAGEPPARRLAVIEQGLAHPLGEGATRMELRVERAVALAELDRLDEAEGEGAWVREHMEGVDPLLCGALASAALRGGSCERAVPWLRLLHEAHDPAASGLLADCLASEDPDEARAVLSQALRYDEVPQLRIRLQKLTAQP